MALIQIKTVSKVVPQCYAYTTPGVPAHDGWTKIGFTERDVETRINEQTHTVGVAHKTWWAMRAAYYMTDLRTRTFTLILKNWELFVKRIRSFNRANAAVGILSILTQNHGVAVRMKM